MDQPFESQVRRADRAAGRQLVERAGTLVDEGASGGALLEAIVQASTGSNPRLPSPAALFDCFTPGGDPELRQEMETAFQVVGRPGVALPEDLGHGDVVLRRALGEGDLVQVAVVRGEQVRDAGSLFGEGIDDGLHEPGLYVPVVEGGAFPGSGRSELYRRVAGPEGYLGLDVLVLRPRGSGTGAWEDLDHDEAVAGSESGVEDDAGVPAEVAEGNQARLEWIGLKKITGGDGKKHLYYLLSGPPRSQRDRSSRFKLKVTNTNRVKNFKKPFSLVRLRNKKKDGSIETVPWGDGTTGWKRIASKELEDEKSRTITYHVSPETRRRAYDPDSPLTWLDVRYRWREAGVIRDTHYGKNTSLAFFLVAPANLMFREGRLVHRDMALNDPRSTLR